MKKGIFQKLYILIFLLFITGCTTITQTVPVYETKRVKVGTQTEYSVKQYKQHPVIKGKVIILPFTNLNKTDEYGKNLSTYIETWLTDRIDEIEINTGFKNNNEEHLFSIVKYDEISNNSILETSPDILKKLKELHDIDYVIAGNIIDKDSKELDVISQVYNTNIPDIVWARRIKSNDKTTLVQKLENMLFPELQSLVTEEKNIPVYKEQVQNNSFETFEVEFPSRLRFFFGNSVYYIAYPGSFRNVNINLRLGLHIAHSFLDHRFYAEGGTVILPEYKKGENGYGFHVFIGYESRLIYRNFFLLLDLALGIGGYAGKEFFFDNINWGYHHTQSMVFYTGIGVGFLYNSFSFSPVLRFGFGPEGYLNEVLTIGIGLNIEYEL